MVVLFFWSSHSSRRFTSSNSTHLCSVFMLFDLYIYIWWEWTYWVRTVQLPAVSRLSLLSIVCWLRFFPCILHQSTFSPPQHACFSSLFVSVCVCIFDLILFPFSPLYWTFYLQVNLVSSRLVVTDALNDTAFSVMNQLDMSWRCSASAVVIIICSLNGAEVCVSCFETICR